MKVVFRISYMGFGGAEQVFLSLAREFKKLHDVMFVTDKNYGNTYDSLMKENIPVNSLDCSRTILSVIPFAQFIDSFKPDIILSAYPDTNGACILSSKLAKHKCKIVLSEHASVIEHFKQRSFFQRIKVKLIIKHLYKYADKIVGVSKGVSDEVSAILKIADKCTFIYNPVRFLPVEDNYVFKKEKGLVIAVGRITPQKNFLMLLEAAKIIKKLNSHLKFKIIGGIDDQQEYLALQEYVANNELNDTVEFVGFCADIENYYRKAELFVLCSACEGFGNVIVEALSFGLPVVSTDCKSGPSEILENGRYGRLVPVGNSLALAESIQAEMTDPSSTIQERQNRTLYFSEKNISNQYIKLFEYLLGD
ncbi:MULTISPECIES: glycosyltransferase [unclassified Endozoicomonas]|uniref:glycosyltransferase n=1 Tax=unclassified Endozoicomonas TaxID=2644528 RepID=UPI003BB4E7CF